MTLLLEAMKNVSRSRELGDIHNTEGAMFFPNANLPDTRTDAVHGFPVVGLQPVLHSVELIPSSAPGYFGKPAKHIE